MCLSHFFMKELAAEGRESRKQTRVSGDPLNTSVCESTHVGKAGPRKGNACSAGNGTGHVCDAIDRRITHTEGWVVVRCRTRDLGTAALVDRDIDDD